MKKNYITLALALTAALSSCDQQAAEFVPNNTTTGTKMTMTATRTDGTNTRTSIDGLTFAWASTDKLGIYLSKKDAKTTFTHLSGAGTDNASFTGTLAPNNEHIYATYPETPTFETSYRGATATFLLPTEQIQKHMRDGSIDPTSAGNYAYMYGRTEQPISTTADFPMEMNHLMTFCDFNLTEIPEGVTVHSLSVTAKTGIPISKTVSLDNNSTTNGAWHTEPLTVTTTYPMEATAGKFTFRLLMFPTSVTSSTVWNVRLNTSEGKYIYEKKFTTSKTYEAGKRYSISLGCSVIGEGNVYIPDVNFKKLLIDRCDTDDDGQISEEEALKVIWLSCNSSDIKSLEGIASFKNLTTLYCWDNQLTSLDVSSNTALTSLQCQDNQLMSLVLSDNTALTSLDCSRNQLPSLDVSDNTALTAFGCSSNQLTSLDLSNNTALDFLDCSRNQLTSLDLSNNRALERLSCSDNQLTSLDLSNNRALTDLSCHDNQLTSLDVSSNTALTSLQCYDNQLTSLDVSSNTALTGLQCYDNQLTSLDVSSNTALTSLHCSFNAITTLDIRPIKALEYFYCDPMKGNGTTNLLKTLTHRAGQIRDNFYIPKETRRIVGN
jgi:Leucine-rich repeat (LRR) protein